MSKNHGLFQNRILRNQFKMAASVMEFKFTTLKNELGKRKMYNNSLRIILYFYCTKDLFNPIIECFWAYKCPHSFIVCHLFISLCT